MYYIVETGKSFEQASADLESAVSHHKPGGSVFRAEVGPICTPISSRPIRDR